MLQRKPGRPKKTISEATTIIETSNTAPINTGRPKKVLTDEEARKYRAEYMKAYYKANSERMKQTSKINHAKKILDKVNKQSE